MQRGDGGLDTGSVCVLVDTLHQSGGVWKFGGVVVVCPDLEQ